MDQNIRREIDDERKRNLEDIIRYARWEAEMAKKLGVKWFELRDKWLWESFEADRERWRDPRVREALIKMIMVVDELKRRRCSSNPLRC